MSRRRRDGRASWRDEVRAAGGDPTAFLRGPRTLLARGTRDDRAAFVVEDGRHLSAR